MASDAPPATPTLDPTVMLKDKVISHEGKVESEKLKNRLIALYFSAHWCPPCRGFTPRLIEAYNTAKAAGVDLEIIFVSSDHDETSFKSYYSSMPWSAISFDPQMSQELRSTFGVNGIPALVVISKDGKLITKDGRGEVARTGSKAFQNWSVYNGPGETLEEASFGCNIC